MFSQNSFIVYICLISLNLSVADDWRDFDPSHKPIQSNEYDDAIESTESGYCHACSEIEKLIEKKLAILKHDLILRIEGLENFKKTDNTKVIVDIESQVKQVADECKQSRDEISKKIKDLSAEGEEAVKDINKSINKLTKRADELDQVTDKLEGQVRSVEKKVRNLEIDVKDVVDSNKPAIMKGKDMVSNSKETTGSNTSESPLMKELDDMMKQQNDTLRKYVKKIESLEKDISILRIKMDSSPRTNSEDKKSQSNNSQDISSRARSPLFYYSEEQSSIEATPKPIEVKSFGRALRNKLRNQNVYFDINKPYGLSSRWKFYLDKKDDYQVGLFLKLLESESSFIAAEFSVKLVDEFGVVQKTQKTGIKNYSKGERTSWGWQNFIILEHAYEKYGDRFSIELNLKVYPEGTLLYKPITSETYNETWTLPDLKVELQQDSIDEFKWNRTFELGSEMDTTTKWIVSLKVIDPYKHFLGLHVSLLESKWTEAFGDFHMKLLDYKDETIAESYGFVRDYKTSAVSESKFISIYKIEKLRKKNEFQSLKLHVRFTFYGRSSRLYRDVKFKI